MKAEEPSSIMKKIKEYEKINKTDFLFCPAVRDANKNTFCLKFPYTYNIKKSSEQNSFYTDHRDQKFFNDHVLIRNLEKNFISILNNFIFFTEEKELKITSQIQPYLENNEINEKTINIPASYDIGKWFRPLEWAFFLKDGCDEINFKEGDIYQYIKFDTDEKIIFKKFIPSETIHFMAKSCIEANNSFPEKKRSLSQYYNLFNIKKKILKEIKENLCD